MFPKYEARLGRTQNIADDWMLIALRIWYIISAIIVLFSIH